MKSHVNVTVFAEAEILGTRLHHCLSMRPPGGYWIYPVEVAAACHRRSFRATRWFPAEAREGHVPYITLFHRPLEAQVGRSCARRNWLGELWDGLGKNQLAKFEGLVHRHGQARSLVHVDWTEEKKIHAFEKRLLRGHIARYRPSSTRSLQIRFSARSSFWSIFRISMSLEIQNTSGHRWTAFLQRGTCSAYVSCLTTTP